MRKLLLCLLLLISVTRVVPALAQENTVYEGYRAQWDGQSRINILVMGMDRRPGAQNNLNARTDVMMIVSFDPEDQRIGLLSIPRDMHMAVIGQRQDLMRINTLMVEGESIQEGYGPYFTMETLQLNFGMYIDAYIAFDFVAFIDFIDAIGGITVNVPSTINDPAFPDMNYGFAPLYIPAGVRQMDGALALAYARTRHNDNDYLRNQRQALVVLGVREKLAQPETTQNLLANLPRLVLSLNGHFYSNMQPEQLAYLGLQMLSLREDDITTASLNEQFSFNYFYAGETVRVPDRELLSQLLIDTFGEDYWE